MTEDLSLILHSDTSYLKESLNEFTYIMFADGKDATGTGVALFTPKRRCLTMFQSINPANEQLLLEYDVHDQQAIDLRLAAADGAFQLWRTASLGDRAKALAAVAGLLRDREREYAELMTAEMGKPITEAQAEIEKCAWVCNHYAQQAEAYLAPRTIDSDARKGFVRYDPLGPVLAIMPWNFPFWQVFRFAAPALMAGNVGLLKHAANVPGCALAIEALFSEAGVPDGVFTTLLVTSKQANEVIANPIVKAVTLTGSERAGTAVATTAGAHLKKCVLELGGSDPFIVLADADLEHVARQAAKARCQNSGQSCIAAKRFIVEEPIAQAFTERFAGQLNQLRVGDPADPQTDVGPLARRDLRDTLHDQVARSIDAGARLLTGGRLVEGPGFFYPPTLLDNVTSEMPVFEEETFGPVAAVIAARDVNHAIELANKSKYGLGASLWSLNGDRAAELAPRIEAGAVFINEIVKSDPRLPFGGIKHSGYGRELSDLGIREFVNIKTVWLGENGSRKS